MDIRKSRNYSREVAAQTHGGRQLDTTVSALRVLPDVVAACPEIPVMVDGGIRRGADAPKALALGARFVWVARPFNYAAAIAGDAGVAHVIALLASEIDRDMAMLGVRSIAELSPQHLHYMAPALKGSSTGTQPS